MTTLDQVKHLAAKLPACHLIGGSWTPPNSGRRLPSSSPATEESLGEIAAGSAEDVAAAVAAARAAAVEWGRMPWRRRAGILRSLAEALRDHREELAVLDVLDAGLPIRGAGFDVDGAVEELHYFAGLAGELKGVTLPRAPNGVASTYRTPYGVVGRIVPFNHPFSFAAGKIAAPLAAGNAVVLKPSEHTSLSALRLGQIASDILPPGVLNIVTGDGPGVGAPLVEHPAVPRIALTGSVSAGQAVLRSAAEHVKHVTLELGGKNPFVLLPGADLDAASQAATRGMNLWRTAGQSCQSTSIAYVHSDEHEDFLERVVARFSEQRVGPPQDPASDLGPLAFRAHFERVLGHIDEAQAQGARLLTGGKAPGLEPGLYVAPTVLDGVTSDMDLVHEEVFGPVLAVSTYVDLDELVESLNDSRLGLTANVWGPGTEVEDVAERLEAGLIWINGRGGKPPGAPFGGFKQSGLGKESCLEELLSYSQEKTVVRP